MRKKKGIRQDRYNLLEESHERLNPAALHEKCLASAFGLCALNFQWLLGAFSQKTALPLSTKHRKHQCKGQGIAQ